ncbi:polyprenyl synthetase family protein [Paenibacillus sp. LHD-117]|uniref:polyprenyl synthetase family protein n=1 Tax=Paenibacillus sp. LHD-117 TaxID=3071412 RepID=UPI0027E08026|nr:polyprenyl synthetase family protein [Paenibacillus sp. LHD-117]MDQ6420097.1 polyprenyl synthetase family protein [Paenibacillus sp. LHD-117]
MGAANMQDWDNLNERIAEEMKALVRHRFQSNRLCGLALRFVEDKLGERMIFGALTFVHFHMCGGDSGHPYQAAAGMELIILASDILDDLEDQDAPSKPWMNVPLPEALHAATSLLTLAQQALLECVTDMRQRGELATMMNNQLLMSADGQMMDIAGEAKDEAAYLEMVSRKSASLFVLACNAGVMAAGREWREDVAAYAEALGLASQMKNDIRDLVRWDDKSDFLQRKPSLALLYLLEGAAESDAWIVDFYEGRLGMEDVRERQALFREALERTGALLYGTVMGRMHYNRFLDLLAAMPVEESWKDLLLRMLNGESPSDRERERDATTQELLR